MRFRTIAAPIYLTVPLLLTAFAYGQASPPATSAKPPAAPIVYRNAQYGFCFVLPASWQGYTIVREQWRGTDFASNQAVHGPQLLIRNPRWTREDPYQDIPIMVFTPPEWQKVVAVTMSVSAAPIGPEELGHNSRYVFALPPRWIGFYDVKGTDEVQTMINQNPFQAPCGHKSTQPIENLP